MATTTALYATGTPTQVAGTWTNPTNATGFPNATGTTAPTNCATWVNAARSTTATLELAGYNFSSQVAANATVTAVTATITHAETSTTVLNGLTVQLYSGTTAIGAAVAVTRSTTLTVGSVGLPTMPTVAQLADLRVRITATRSNSTTSTTEYIDAVALQVTYSMPAVSTLTDDFSTSTNWTLITGGTVTGGQLVLPTTTGFPGAATVDQYSLIGSSASVQLVQTGGTSVSQTHFYLDAGGNYDIRFQVIGSSLKATYKVNGVESTPASITYNPAVHKFLRLTESGGNVLWDWSTDGNTWTNLNTTSWSVAGMKVDKVRPTFYSGYDGTGATPADSVFDNFNIILKPKIETFTDDFATADTGKWTFAANASVTGGQLQLTSSATYQGVDSVASYDLTGSSLIVEVPQVAGGGTTLDTEMNMQVGTAAGQVDNKLTMLHENGTLYFRARIAAVNNDTTLAYSATAHRWWRIAESGGVVTFSTAPDGQTWTVRRSWTNTGIAVTAMNVRLQTGYWSAEATPGAALYDNVNLPPTGGTAPTVGAGPDTTAHQNAAFWRLATESGASISARAWTITAGPAGVGSTIGTAAALVWTPTVTGTYTLQYAATNAGGTGTDTVTVTVVATPAPLAAWQAALTAKTAQAVLLGDSLTEGQAATTMAARWVNLIQPTIRTSASITGGGVGYLPGWTATWVGWTPYTSQTGSNTKLSSDLSLGLRTDGMSAAATTTYTVTGTSADLHWVAGYGSFTWAVDGGGATTVSTAGTTGTPSRTRITLGSATSHTLTITATTAVHFSGVMVYNGDETSGARFYEAGHSAFNSDAFLGGAALWSLINADLYVIELGVNDFLHVTATSTQVRDYLRRMVDEIRSSASGKDPSIAVLIPGAWPQGIQDAGQTELWSAYQAAIASLGTDEPSIAVITMPNLTTGQLDSDLLHPINAGQTAIASTVATALSLSGTLDATGTASLSGTGTLTASGTPRPVSTAALSGTGTLTPGTGTPRPAATADLSGTGTLAAGTGTPRPAATATLSGTGTLAAGTGTPRPVQTAALSGSGTLTPGTGAPVLAQTAQLSGAGTLVSGGAPAVQGAAVLSGSGTLTTGGALAYAGTAALSGTGTLAATGIPAAAGTAALSGAGTLTPSGASAPSAAAALSGTGTLTAAGAPSTAGAAALSGAGTLTAAGTPRPVGTAVLSGSGTLAAAPAGVTAGQAAVLSGEGSLTAAGAVSTAGTAALSGEGTLAVPVPTAAAGGQAALSGSGTLAPASGLPAAAQQTTLSGSGSLLAAGTPRTAQTAALSGTGTLTASGLATGEGTGAVSLSGTGTLAVAGVPALQRTAALSGTGTLSTTGAPRSTQAAVLSGTGTLVAGGSGSQAGGAAAALSGTGSLATTGGARTQGAVGLSGSGTLNATGTGKSAGGGSAALGGSGTLSTTALPGMGRPAALSGLGTFVPVGVVRLAGMANLSGSGQLVALGVTGGEPPVTPEAFWVRVGPARERWQVRAGPLRTAVRVGPALPMPLLVRPMRR